MVTPNIIKQDTCIMTPRQWSILREHLNAKYQIICDVLLNTGMRVEEFWEFVDHPHWLSSGRRCIDIPKGFIHKSRCTVQERTVLLSLEGLQACQTMIGANGSIKYTDRSNMRKALIEAATSAKMDVTGIKPKMFRKTLISWLMATVPEKDPYILASAGHGREVQQRHYLAMGFEKRDVDDMRKYLRGWGE